MTRRVEEAARTGSLNWVLTSVMTLRMLSSLANMSSVEPIPPPMRDDIWLIIGPMRPLSVESLPSAFSSTVGKERKRSVCPVGAVSNTITEYSIDLTCLGMGGVSRGHWKGRWKVFTS